MNKLKQIVSDLHVTTQHEELLCYSYDATGMEYLPAAVLFPGSTSEISEILKLTYAHSIPVVPRGAGSGMTGGALPVEGGIVVAMSRFNRIIEIDRENQIAIVEPGVITGQFQEEVRKKGLYYPPDPASSAFCTLGGNVAECAGGPSAVKYGVTRDYVLGLELVLPDGRVVTTGVKTAKGVVGYDLTRLFVGSEGTLGIITKIIVRLVPYPEKKTTQLLLADTMGRAVSLVTRILATQTPCTLEYMDKTALSLVADNVPHFDPDRYKAALLIEFDGDAEFVVMQEKKLVQELGTEPGIKMIGSSCNDAASLWQARRSLSAAAFKLKPNKLNDDVVVPRNRITDLVAFAEKLMADSGVVIFTFGHAGDGNIHVNIMYDKEVTAEWEKAVEAKESLLAYVVSLGGTISGEHGVGMTKAAYLHLELSPNSIGLMKDIKRLFDPKNLMNPGKIFPSAIKGG